MILRYLMKKQDYRLFIGIGQTCLIAGALGLLAGTSRILNSLIVSPPTLDFIQGFLVGISGASIGLALVLNIKGLLLLRRNPES